MPEKRDPEVYRIYMEARKRWRTKIAWEFTREELLSISADVQFAASKGDWGAKALLAHFYLQGLGPLPTNNVLQKDLNKAVEIQREAVANGQPWGYYDLGVAYEYGYGDIEPDEKIAWGYYLKAAKLGSPDAQMALAAAYRKAERPEAELAMFQCAYAQGHAAAAEILAIDAEGMGRLTDSLRLYQDGVKLGGKNCAASLYLIFGKDKSSAKDNSLDGHPVTADPERSRRYEEIMNALAINPDLKFGRLDKVLPLPPAALPEWHGIEAALTPEPEGPPTY
ncbi:hypothetical protein GCM10027277_32760 [Pseudoduganella ginsengisoli]